MTDFQDTHTQARIKRIMDILGYKKEQAEKYLDYINDGYSPQEADEKMKEDFSLVKN